MNIKNYPEFHDFLRKNLVYSSVVSNEFAQKQMFESYLQQMRAKGVAPEEFDSIIFLSSGMSYRDDDMDFSPSDVRKEADNVVCRYLKDHPEVKINTVVFSIGLEPGLYVEDVHEPPVQKHQNCERER